MFYTQSDWVWTSLQKNGEFQISASRNAKQVQTDAQRLAALIVAKGVKNIDHGELNTNVYQTFTLLCIKRFQAKISFLLVYHLK